ncbi:MAG: thioredoxin family protein [Clostridiaceae bacterium]|nr:thioredoxin family protein [Clostridiaceae bacterium]
MKEITYFYLKTCPYCRQADRLIQELIEKEPQFAAVPVRKIEEREHAEIADQYNYYFVPCFYIGKEKMMEGVPSLEQVQKTFQAALE